MSATENLTNQGVNPTENHRPQTQLEAALQMNKRVIEERANGIFDLVKDKGSDYSLAQQDILAVDQCIGQFDTDHKGTFPTPPRMGDFSCFPHTTYADDVRCYAVERYLAESTLLRMGHALLATDPQSRRTHLVAGLHASLKQALPQIQIDTYLSPELEEELGENRQDCRVDVFMKKVVREMSSTTLIANGTAFWLLNPATSPEQKVAAVDYLSLIPSNEKQSSAALYADKYLKARNVNRDMNPFDTLEDIPADIQRVMLENLRVPLDVKDNSTIDVDFAIEFFKEHAETQDPLAYLALLLSNTSEGLVRDGFRILSRMSDMARDPEQRAELIKMLEKSEKGFYRQHVIEHNQIPQTGGLNPLSPVETNTLLGRANEAKDKRLYEMEKLYRDRINVERLQELQSYSDALERYLFNQLLARDNRRYLSELGLGPEHITHLLDLRDENGQPLVPTAELHRLLHQVYSDKKRALDQAYDAGNKTRPEYDKYADKLERLTRALNALKNQRR